MEARFPAGVIHQANCFPCAAALKLRLQHISQFIEQELVTGAQNTINFGLRRHPGTLTEILFFPPETIEEAPTVSIGDERFQFGATPERMDFNVRGVGRLQRKNTFQAHEPVMTYQALHILRRRP